MGYQMILQIVKRIPWSKVVQNAPLILEMAGRARERFSGQARVEQHDHWESLNDQVAALEQENAKLRTVVRDVSDRLEQTTLQLQKAQARIATLSVALVLTFLVAVGELVALLFR